LTGIKEVVKLAPQASHALIVSSDIPTLTRSRRLGGEHCLQTDHDVYYNVIERHVMEKRFPGSNGHIRT
jgi:hypothetical protein